MMPKWEDALSQGMRFCVPLKVREFSIVTERTMEILLDEWGKEKESTDENGTVAIENPEDVPSNQSVFEFVQKHIVSAHPAFQITKYQKHGIFAKIMSEDDCHGVHVHTSSHDGTVCCLKDGGCKAFVYKAPWAPEFGHQFLQLQVGDAFRIENELGQLHTIANSAVQENHEVFIPPVSDSKLLDKEDETCCASHLCQIC